MNMLLIKGAVLLPLFVFVDEILHYV